MTWIILLQLLVYLKQKSWVDPNINADLPRYYSLSQTPTSNARGTGFYVKNNVSHTIRDELCTTQPEFESIWVEFEVPHKHNIVCGLIYIVCGIADHLPNFLSLTSYLLFLKTMSCSKTDYSKLPL